MCGVPGTISWSQPGQRYALVLPAPGCGRTTQSPSGQDSVRSGPGTGAGGPERSRRILRGLTPVHPMRAVEFRLVRLVIARCSVDYVGRLTAHLPSALRLLIVKADGSVLVHSDGGSYKPLNWMSPPCKADRAARPVVGHQQGRRDAGDHHHRGDQRRLGQPGRRPGAGQGRRGGAPAGAAGRAARGARRRLAAGPPRVPDPDRPGRPDVPGRRGAQRGRRDQTPRRDRRGRATYQIPGPAEPGPAAGPGARRVRRPGDQAAGARARRSIAASAA